MAQLVIGKDITLMANDIVATKNISPGDISYAVMLHTPEDDYSIQLLTSIDIMRDYNGSIGDYTSVEFRMYADKYLYEIHPYKDNLELTIIIKEKKKTITNRYKFVIINQSSTDAEKTKNLDKEMIANSQLYNIIGQCINLETEAVRNLYVDGIYKNVTMEKLVTAELLNMRNKITINGENLELDCNMATPDNKTEYGHVTIPSGVKAVDLASYLQSADGYGIYNGNIGTYIQKYKEKSSVWVFPLYDNLRYDNESKLPKLIVVEPATALLDFAENTYKEDGNLHVLNSGELKLIDQGENEMMDNGTGYISVNPVGFIDRSSSISKTSVTADGDTLMTSAVSKDRRDGNSAAVYVGNGTNMYKVRSDFQRQTFANYHVKWNYCNMDLIYPGMPCCIFKQDRANGVSELKGVVQGTYHRWNNADKTRMGIISIMVEKPAVYYEKKAKK